MLSCRLKHARKYSFIYNRKFAKESIFVPTGYVNKWNSSESAEIAEHLKWMGQKSLLGQDMYLLGPPGPLKRHLAMTMAELCGWEVEYVHITKDTTESDIKQVRVD